MKLNRLALAIALASASTSSALAAGSDKIVEADKITVLGSDSDAQVMPLEQAAAATSQNIVVLPQHNGKVLWGVMAAVVVCSGGPSTT